MNGIFALLLVGSVVMGAWAGTMQDVSRAVITNAQDATQLALGLVGQMALWLGFMAILEKAGALHIVARALRPVMVHLFPSVPPEHPATVAIILNVVANILGLGNAATPFGLKAMVELERLNPHPGQATNAMALFLAINTSGVAVMPFKVMGSRAELGATQVSGIVLPTLLATFFSTVVAIIAAKSLQSLAYFRVSEQKTAPEHVDGEPAMNSDWLESQIPDSKIHTSKIGTHVHARWLAVSSLVLLIVAGGLARFVVLEWRSGTQALDLLKEVSNSWLIPLFVMSIALIGLYGGVKIYEVFVEGAKEGFQVGVRLIPYLVAILVAVGMFRASGAMGVVLSPIEPMANWLGIPVDVLPIAFIRPLSWSGAYSLMIDVMKSQGVDSYAGFLSSVLCGSTETTFYVLAVYFGVVGIRRARHTVIACLCADMGAVAASIFFSRIFF